MGSWIWIGFVGLIVGLLARILWRTHNGILHLIILAALGIAGSYVGTFLGQVFGFYGSGEWAGIGGSVVGAVVLLLIWRIVFHRHAPPGATPPPAPPPQSPPPKS